ncbi:hypothetical protein JCM8097_005849 [Rhodosporidiobolus ruineniae]
MAALLESLLEAQSSDVEVLYPPIQFSMVLPGVYRSGHPGKSNFPYLETLKLKSIMYLCTDDYRHDTHTWALEKGLNIFHLRIEVSKDPTVEVDEGMVKEALEKVLDKRNLPILIHDNKGRLMPSLVSSLLRLVCGWTLDAALHEYRLFLPPVDYGPEDAHASDEASQKKAKKKEKERIADIQFIDRFPVDQLSYDPDYAPYWLNR